MSLSLVDSIFGGVTSAAPSTSAAACLFETKIEIPEQQRPVVVPKAVVVVADEGTAGAHLKRSREEPAPIVQPKGSQPKKERKKPRHQQESSVKNKAESEADATETTTNTTATTASTATTTATSTNTNTTSSATSTSTATNEEADQPVDIVENRTLFVGNLPSHYDRKMLHHLFADCGKIESTRIRCVATTGVKLPPQQAGNQALVQKVCANTGRRDEDQPCVAGYVVFASVASVDAALAKNGAVVQGRHLRVDRVTPTHDAARTAFVGNLPYSADEESLARHVLQSLKVGATKDKNEGDTAAAIENVRIVRDPATRQCKGFAYVLFREASTVARALRHVHESIYRKRTLRVQVCGKRYKNQRGATTVPKATARRQTAAATAVGALQRVLAKKLAPSNTANNNKRKRSNKTDHKTVKATGAGVSKRAAAQAKSNQRVKKIEKRITNGMGKTRQKSS